MDPETLTKEAHIASQPPSALQPLRQPAHVPTEILVELFLLSLPPMDVAQAPQKAALALVCGFWNAIIESTPILWSRITIADKIQFVGKSLLKSGDCPIVVNGKRPISHGFRGYICDGICCQFLRAVKPHAQRWKHVVLQASVCRERYTPSATFFPLLESLRLHSNPNSLLPNQYYPLLESANTPHLRDVLLDGTKLGRWNISFPSGLSKLDIRNTSPASAELLSVLATCPNLNTLHLRKISLPVKDDVDNYTRVPVIVELTALQELNLDDVSTFLVQDLLEQLRIPEECTISLKCVISESSPSTSFLTPVLLRYHGGFQRAEEIDRLTIVHTPRGFHLIAEYRRWFVNLGLYGVGAIRDALGWFGIGTKNDGDSLHLDTSPAESAIPNNMLVSLKFAKSIRTDISLMAFDPIFDLQCITRIKATRLSFDQQSSLLSCLSYLGYQTAGMKEAWLFAGLSELVVKGLGEDVLKGVINMVKRRSGGASAGAPGSRARLRMIEFVHECDDGIRKEEERLVPDPTKAEWQLFLQLLDLLDDDARVFRNGKRVTKTRVERLIMNRVNLWK